MKNKSGIEPLGYHVLVKLDAPKQVREKSAGGIVLPQTALDARQQEAATATVIAVGAHAWSDIGNGKSQIKVGDIVGHARYAGRVTRGIDGEPYVVMTDKDIICRINQ